MIHKSHSIVEQLISDESGLNISAAQSKHILQSYQSQMQNLLEDITQLPNVDQSSRHDNGQKLKSIDMTTDSFFKACSTVFNP